MKPSAALQLVNSIIEQTRMTPPEHRQVQEAMLVLKGLVFPPKKASTEAKDKPNE